MEKPNITGSKSLAKMKSDQSINMNADLQTVSAMKANDYGEKRESPKIVK